MKKVIAWILSIFSGFQNAYEKFKPTAEKAVAYVNTIKAGIESGTLDSLAAITPSPKDDEVVIKIKYVFGRVASEVAVAEGIISGNINAVGAVSALSAYLAGKSKSARLKFWVELSGKIIEALADGKLTIAEAIALGQLIYSQLSK